MQEAVSHTPLLLPTSQSDSLVVQANNPAAPLLLIAINEPHYLADGDLIPPKALCFPFPNLNIRAIEVDRGIGKP